jgi:hypothetical protein
MLSHRYFFGCCGIIAWNGAFMNIHTISDDPFVRLLARILEQAVIDARGGDSDARSWLLTTVPEWRRYWDDEVEAKTI